MTYSEKLKSPKWQKKRLEILNRDNFTCQMCADKETELHVHHLKYNGEPYEVSNEELQTLCKHCHEIETYSNKINEKLIFVHKLSENIFGKLKSGKIIIASIDFKNNIHISCLINNPKGFSVILKSLITNG